jgi:hypothetical protein
MEVAVCSIFSRPVTLPIRHYDVAFPAELDDTAISEAGIDHSAKISKFTSKRIWLLRQIEAEIISVLQQDAPLPLGCPSLDDWMRQIAVSITSWHDEVYQAAAKNTDPDLQSRWEEMMLWADIGYPYLQVLLYRPSKRIPRPSNQAWMTAFTSAVQMTVLYCKQVDSDDVKIKDVFQPCHHCFASALVFLQALVCCKLEITASHSWEKIESWMSLFSKFFSTITERWPAAARCLEEYERLLEPIKAEYLDHANSKQKSLSTYPSSQASAALGNELGEVYHSWAASNASLAVETPEALNSYAYWTPPDWKREFNLDLSVATEAIPGS